ncbi:MAG TPA: MBL fold metallo-hydrolase [Rectinemataceae bacterium]|nr:MBL fold metallo-hydrolase [Rectinemataceae bacterium]
MVDRIGVGPIGENAYVVSYEQGCVLVDPGDESERLLSFIDSRRCKPLYVAITHGHLDHTAALPELRAAWAARGLTVPIAVHAADADYFGPKGEATNHQLFTAIRALGYFTNYWRPMPSADILLGDGDILPGTALRVIHTPGHTKGSICLYDETGGFLLSGDTLFRDGVGRTDGPDSDPDELAASLERLFALPPSTHVFPGHGEPTTISRERGRFPA